jgi:hypothetical protein
MRERPVDQIGVDLLHHRVITMVFFGLHQPVGAVGEDRMVAVGGEQFVLAAPGLAVEPLNPAHDQPGGDGLALLAGERGVADLGDLLIGDSPAHLVVEDGVRVLDRRPCGLIDDRDRCLDLGVHLRGDGEPHVILAAGAMTPAL